MRQINSRGYSFLQGSNDISAAAEEKPCMENSFTYNYSIDATEVTQGNYFEITGRRPVSAESKYGVGDSNPVYNVTWFDAILYCNARSKKSGLDTIYSYIGVNRSSDSSVNQLEGIIIHLERIGYRLPTEAEWEFAARAGTSTSSYWGNATDSITVSSYAWYCVNSSDITHQIGVLRPNDYGLHDMAGNVSEWINDWKGSYQQPGFPDFLGAQQPSPQYERVIKGGSFLSTVAVLRPASRGEVYATIPSTKTAYIGFRCVIGAIANGNFLSSNGIPAHANPVQITATKDQIKNLFATTRAKIAFVNITNEHRNLCYVDFSEQYPQVHEIFDTMPVFHCAISPNGSKVAFCTKGEGFHGSSKIYIRNIDPLGSGLAKISPDSAFIPRWWVRPGSQDTFIVFTNSSIADEDNLSWQSTKTFLQKIERGIPSDSPILLCDGSYHDGLSSDGRYVATGYTRLRVNDLQGGNSKTLFTYPQNGKDSTGSIQVCNASMSRSVIPHVLFLDFGYQKTSRITSTSYGIHEYLFIADVSGNIIQWVHCPAGYEGWDQCEWSNQENFIVSGATSATLEHNDIFIMANHQGSSFANAKILSGTKLWDPSLWVGDSIIYGSVYLNFDSLARYNDPPADEYQGQLAEKMFDFWGLHDSLEFVFLGSSHVKHGIDPSFFDSLDSYNMGAAAGDLLGLSILIKNYILEHCPCIKIIGINLDPGWLANQNGNVAWLGGMEKTRGYNYDKSHQFWQGGLPDHFEEVIMQVPYPTASMRDITLRGFQALGTSNWGDSWCMNTSRWDTSDTNYRKNLQLIDSLAGMLSVKNINFLIVNFPMNPAFKLTDFFGRYGPTWTTAQHIIADVKTIENKRPNVHFYDAYNNGDHDYTDEDAVNSDHLSGKGAAKLSARIDSVISTILK